MSKPKLKRQILIEAGSPVEFFAAKNIDGEKDSPPAFSMIAYTGGQMNVSGWYLPVVIDLAGLSLGRKNQPILKDHTFSEIVGHATNVRKEGSNVIVEGICSGAGIAKEEVVASSKNGFPWQASVGVEVNRVVEIADGKTVSVNGSEFTGPLYVARKAKLNEVSFVALGADENTSAKVAAKAAEDLNVETEEIQMTNDVKNAEAQEPKNVEATKASEEVKETKVVEAEKEVKASVDVEAGIKAMREEQARISKINAACKDYPEVAEKAIAEGMSVEAAKAAMFDVMNARNASNINAAYINTGAGSQETNAEVLTAAACMSTGAIKAGKLEDNFSEKTLDAAHKLRNLGLKGLIEACIKSEGGYVSASMSSDTDLITAGFSTISLPNMLSNLANKSLLDAYQAKPSTAALLAERLSANDFKQNTGVQIGGVGLMEPVQNGGEIKHGTMSEESFTYRVNTKAKIIGITRKMLIDDDLSGFTRLAASLGQSAYNSRENDFWALVLANTDDFFSDGNNNIVTDGDVLSIDGITAAEQIFMEQTSIDGTPANIMGRYLVVPPALASTARAIFTGQKVVGATSTVPDVNIYSGEYIPVVTPYLSNSAVNANASDTGWYLFSDTVKAFGIAYLRGNETPVVEEVTTSPEFLGRTWRAYFDYGVCQVDKRGAVFSKGDAS
jgi:DNA-nicking Smr family endonuclease